MTQARQVIGWHFAQAQEQTVFSEANDWAIDRQHILWPSNTARHVIDYHSTQHSTQEKRVRSAHGVDDNDVAGSKDFVALPRCCRARCR